MTRTLVNSLHISVTKLANRVSAQALDGHTVGGHQLSYIMESLRLDIAPTHLETIRLLVVEHTRPALVLGLQWLRAHNPQLDWRQARVLAWSHTCAQRGHTPTISALTTTIESPNAQEQIAIPNEYKAFATAFSPKKAARLPPHRPWDC